MNKEKIWKSYLREEIDAAFLYRILGEKTVNEAMKDTYLRLAVVEDQHAEAWKNLLAQQQVHVRKATPSARAKILAKLSGVFGTEFLRQIMLREESSEVKSYLGLYNSSTDQATRKIALSLARDSAQHAGQLTDLMGGGNEPWHSTGSGDLLRNVVYGFNDGLTANFGLIAGIIGAQAAPHIILITGIAGTIADALSMASSGYLAAVSEKEVYEHEKSMEADEIKHMPELETEELALIYEAKGIRKEEAQQLAKKIMKDPELALEEKVREELGITERSLSPFKEAWITGSATAIGAIIPVLPFFFLQGASAIWTAFAIAMIAHFAVGAARSFFTGRSIFRSGFDMFVVGMGIAVAGYFIGELITRFL